MKLTKSRATTAEWQSVYPWHFGGAIPSIGPVVGIDQLTGGCTFGFDPFGLVAEGVAQNPNIVVAGAPANGKSAFAKQVIWNLVGAFGYRFVTTDVKGEYRPLAHALGVPVLDLHPGGASIVNPLDDPEGRLKFMRALAALCLERSLEPVESAALAAAVRMIASLPEPTVPDLIAVLREMPGRMCEELSMDRQPALDATQALRFGLGELMTGSLSGMFDRTSNINLSNSPRGFVVDVSGCGSDDRELRFALLAGQRAVDQMVATATAPTIINNDEAWRLAGTPETVRWMQLSSKLGRNSGIANMLIVHRFAELGAQADGAIGQIASRLVADSDIHVMFRQGDTADAADSVSRLGMPRSTEGILAELPAHRALIHIRGRLAMLDVMLSKALRGLADTNAAMRSAPAA